MRQQDARLYCGIDLIVLTIHGRQSFSVVDVLQFGCIFMTHVNEAIMRQGMYYETPQFFAIIMFIPDHHLAR